MQEIFIKDYTYELPFERIPTHPLAQRDESKLLVYKPGIITETVYYNLYNELPQNSFLVMNNTKVDEVRLLFTKPSGGIIEIFCLEPGNDYGDITTAMLQKQSVKWKCLVGGVKKWKENFLQKQVNTVRGIVWLRAKRLQREADYFIIDFEWSDAEMTFAEVLHLFGEMPLPPYLNRRAEKEDAERYQTVYAKYDGSVAAPTAGLHFTEVLFQKLAEKNIQHDFVTLHVGAGTFKPVKSETVAAHEMHAEYIEVKKIFLENLLNNVKAGNKIIAVGTTSLRTLESLYWMGVKVLVNESVLPEYLEMQQWEMYDMTQNVKATDALMALIKWMELKQIPVLYSKTKIIIVPGYKVRVADAILTNFHQPQSTLLLLVAAIAGEEWRRIYNYALKHKFRFLSYGDGSLLWKN